MDDQERQTLSEWEATLDFASYYEILGVDQNADEAAVRQAFHDFSASFHPDAHRDANVSERKQLERLFQRASEAYRVLSQPKLRAEYDSWLDRGHVRYGIPSRPPGAPASLEDLCRSAAGKLHASRADQLIAAGDRVSAARELALAIRAESTPATELDERLASLEATSASERG